MMFVLEFTKPNFDILKDLSAIHCSIAKRNTGRIIGTGPYSISKLDNKKKKVFLKKNKFFNREEMDIEEFMLTTDETALNPDLSIKTKRVLNPRLNKAYWYFEPAIYFMGFNINHKDYGDIKVRAGLANLMDIKLIESVYGKIPYKIGGFIPLGMFGHNPNLMPAEHTDIKDLQYIPDDIVLYYHRKKPRNLAEAFCDKIKVLKSSRCVAQEINMKQLTTGTKNGDIGVFLSMFKPSISITSDLLSIFLLDSGLNLFSYHSKTTSNTKLDQLVRASLKLNNNDNHIDLFHNIDRLIINNYYVKPFLYGTEKTIYYSKYIKLPYMGLLGPADLFLSQIRAVAVDDE